MMFSVTGNVIFLTHFLNIVNVGGPEMTDTFPFAGVYYYVNIDGMSYTFSSGLQKMSCKRKGIIEVHVVDIYKLYIQ